MLRIQSNFSMSVEICAVYIVCRYTCLYNLYHNDPIIPNELLPAEAIQNPGARKMGYHAVTFSWTSHVSRVELGLSSS